MLYLTDIISLRMTNTLSEEPDLEVICAEVDQEPPRAASTMSAKEKWKYADKMRKSNSQGEKPFILLARC